ncbi:MAG: division/cell wall cluster transcriptional repressor MraZ [Candidatus Omnitrophica bacterium]|nr:division/cell wall cluster transcriptional repressor MraZ [Candidatus Omnitrophota bacterium]
MEESGMWYGQYFHTLDNKDRFILPAKFREKLKKLAKKKFYITRGLDNCLFLFDQAIWEQLEEKLREIPFTRQQARSFNRLLFSGAQEIDIDSQGRMVVPGYLKDIASIKREIVIVGVADRMEIWDKDIWNKFYNSNNNKFEEVAENLFG